MYMIYHVWMHVLETIRTRDTKVKAKRYLPPLDVIEASETTLKNQSRPARQIDRWEKEEALNGYMEV